MSSFSSSLDELAQSGPKVIDARTHGILDYCHAAFFLTLGFISLRHNKRAAIASLATGSAVLVQSLLTDYPLGVRRLLPFAVHGQMDVAFAASSWAIPHLAGFGGTTAALIFESNSLVESTIIALTDFSSEHARREEQH